MNRFFQSHFQNLQFTTVKMAYVTCLVTKNFTFELPGKCVYQGSQGLYNFSIIINGKEYVVHDDETCSKSQRRSLKLEIQHPASWTQGQKGKYKGKICKTVNDHFETYFLKIDNFRPQK